MSRSPKITSEEVYDSTKRAVRKDTVVQTAIADEYSYALDQSVREQNQAPIVPSEVSSSDREPATVTSLVTEGHTRSEGITKKSGLPVELEVYGASLDKTRQEAADFCPDINLGLSIGDGGLGYLLKVLSGAKDLSRMISEAISNIDYGLLEKLVDCIQRLSGHADDLGLDLNMGMYKKIINSAKNGDVRSVIYTSGMADLNSEYYNTKDVVRRSAANAKDKRQIDMLVHVTEDPIEVNPNAPDDLDVVVSINVPITSLITTKEKVSLNIRDTDNKVVDGVFLSDTNTERNIADIDSSVKDLIHMSAATARVFQ